MDTIIIFIALSIPVILISWRTLFSAKKHGFYRFFSWECIIWLFASNYKYWITEPFSIKQIISWIFLIISAYLIIFGALLLKNIGKPTEKRNDKKLYKFEQTSELVNTGIFKYIRHPLYSSLLFLTWGIYFKNTTVILFVISILSTIFLFITAILDEKECLVHFGEQYKDYMKQTKRFIPFLF